MVGFGDLHYKYASGREGDTFIVGFSPRKQNLTIYGLGLTQIEGQAALLEKLGKHTTGKGCLYINRLEGVHVPTLRKLVEQAFRTKKKWDTSKNKPLQSLSLQEPNMQLGTFSVGLAVKDIQASAAFYEKLGFKPFGGDMAQNWLILKNGECVIGLFQGMFEKNILTFNPGWDGNTQKLDSFTDVRELQRQLKAQGITFATEADESTTGPASFVVVDPDGNPILFDQHV